MGTNMAATEKSNDLSGLEKSLEELEALVVRLESGDLPLEQALKEFERGVKLTRQCQAALQEAEHCSVASSWAGGNPLPLSSEHKISCA